MIELTTSGSFNRSESFLQRMFNWDVHKLLDKYGQLGVEALSDATPERTGKTASSWEYKVSSSGSGYTIEWSNTNVNDGVNIAVILQYGHGTGWGGYVKGTDYINPALKNTFEQLAQEAWNEVIKA